MDRAIGIVCLIDALSYGPEPKEVARETREIINLSWKGNPKAHDATIHNVTLVLIGRKTYTGFADVTFAGQPERLILQAVVEAGILKK